MRPTNHPTRSATAHSHGIALALMAATSVSCAVQSPEFDGPRRHSPNASAVQALIGAARYRDLEFRRVDSGNPSNFAEADLSTMPALGLAGHYDLAGDDTQFGLDGSVIVSWDDDRGVGTLSGGSGPVTVLDRSLLLVDLSMGLYGSTILRDSVRLYAAAGPSLVYGEADYEDELTADSDTTVGFGGYARTGIEFRLRNRSFLGLGARWTSSELDFGDPVGDVDIEGWQFFITYTMGL